MVREEALQLVTQQSSRPKMEREAEQALSRVVRPGFVQARGNDKCGGRRAQIPALERARSKYAQPLRQHCPHSMAAVPFPPRRTAEIRVAFAPGSLAALRKRRQNRTSRTAERSRLGERPHAPPVRPRRDSECTKTRNPPWLQYRKRTRNGRHPLIVSIARVVMPLRRVRTRTYLVFARRID